MRAAWAVAALAITACTRQSSLESCADDLSGVWRAEIGADTITMPALGEPGAAPGRWMILDRGATLEAYPLFADGRPAPLVLAPRVIDLTRTGAQVTGTLSRIVMRGADRCDARAPFAIRACAGDALDLDVTDVAIPRTIVPCTWPPIRASHRERWRRD